MSGSRFAMLMALSLTMGCTDRAFTASLSQDASLAKGGDQWTSVPAAFTITDAGNSLASDGKGVYTDGVCGVVAWWSSDGGFYLSTALGRIPRSQRDACAGIAPRAATVTLALRHVSDDPHVDESPSPSAFTVVNIKFGDGAAQATTINAGNNGTPICGTLGLRYTSVTFPGSSDVIREDLGSGLWHMYTRPWPDNMAYCENGGIVTFWHVSFDLYAQILGG